MPNKNKQKILAIGNPMMIHRLSAKIDPDDFVVTGCHNPAEAAEILEHLQFDMVIVDNLVDNARLVCRNTAILSSTPVALLLQEKPVNWKGLGALNVDGFLADGGTNAELMARIRAYIRRKPND